MTLRDWLVVLVIGFAGAFLGAVFTTVAPVLPQIASHYGGGQEGAFVAEWLLTAPSIGIVAGAPVAGWFVERTGARAMLLICLLAFGMVGLGGLVIENSTLLLVSRFIVGVAAAGQATAATALLGETFTGSKRGFVIGFQVAVATVLSILITLAAGGLAEIGGWRAPFSLHALALLVAVIAAVCVASSGARPQRSRGSMGRFGPLVPTFMVVTATMMVAFISTNQVPLMLSGLGLSKPSLLSVVLGGGSLATTAGALLYSKILRGVGSNRTAALGGALQGIGILSLALAQSAPLVVLGSVVLGLGSGILYPGFSHRILDRAPESAKGRAIGLLFAAQFIGPFLSTALVVPAIAGYGRRDSLLAIGIVLLVGWISSGTRRQTGKVAAPEALLPQGE